MNRVIKFRGWDGRSLHADIPLALSRNPSFPTQLSSALDTVLEHGWTLMQFTGLTDKNGKPIYEGDICKVHDFEVEEVEIRWYQESAGFAGYNKKVENTLQNPWVQISPNHYEVIGNIYENSDLLK